MLAAIAPPSVDRPDAYDGYNARLDREMKSLLWEDQKGGGGYYINEHGRSSSQTCWTTLEYWQMTCRPDVSDYVLTGSLEQACGATAAR